MIGQLSCVRVTIRLSAATPILLIGPEYHPDSAPRLELESMDQPHSLPGCHRTTPVIHGALTDVPGVDVTTQDHDFLWPFPSGHLGHDIPGAGVSQRSGLHR